MNLCLMAHPDDETLACGGLIASDPKDWHVAVLADGVSSRSPLLNGPEYVVTPHRQRHEHFKAAMEVLGVTSYESRGLPDQRLDALDFLDLAKGVTEIIERIKPTAVYTHFRGDLNRDHRLVNEAVHVACRPPQRIAIYECEVPSSTEWGVGPAFTPNVFVELSAADMAKKREAFVSYVDEVRQVPHPRSEARILARAEYWGSVAGCYFAEPFMLAREVR